MLLSVPWNLMATTQNIEKPYLNHMLCSYLTKCLCNLIERLVKFVYIVFNGKAYSLFISMMYIF